MARRYTRQQLAQVMNDANAKDWQDVLDYLEGAGAERSGLVHDERAELEEDLEKLKDRGEPFSRDATTVYRIIESIQPVRTTFSPGTPPPGHEGR